MAIILHIETSADICSVALSRDEELMCELSSEKPRSHASELAVLIDKILKDHALTAPKLNAVSVSKGPGSYTGLRIGVSTAKGICYGADIPLITVNTLQALALGGKKQLESLGELHPSDLLCPMLDARRMEVYMALYNAQMEEIRPTEARIITVESFEGVEPGKTIRYFGPGAEKCKDTLKNQHVLFLDQVTPSAVHMIPFAVQAYQQQDFANLAYFEPYYLKDFVATKPKRKVL